MSSTLTPAKPCSANRLAAAPTISSRLVAPDGRTLVPALAATAATLPIRPGVPGTWNSSSGQGTIGRRPAKHWTMSDTFRALGVVYEPWQVGRDGNPLAQMMR